MALIAGNCSEIPKSLLSATTISVVERCHLLHLEHVNSVRLHVKTWGYCVVCRCVTPASVRMIERQCVSVCGCVLTCLFGSVRV